MVEWHEQEITGWGRYPRVKAQVARPERRSELIGAMADANGTGFLAHGLGRSYGDAALLEGGKVVLTRRLDRMLAFDPETGWLRCESGVSIEDILEVFVPRGFFPPVTPGTKFVTVGGALGCDIHGKNHHVDGCWSNHIRRVELLTGRGDIVFCDANHEPELFRATVGGMGLTGVILSMEVKLARIDNPYIEMESIRVEGLDHFFEVSAESADYTHTVSWIDCATRGAGLGRGIFMRGRHARAGIDAGPGAIDKVKSWVEPLLDVPVMGPSWLLNKATIRLFNEAYFRKQPRGARETVTHYDPFFYPLDAITRWNRIYGNRGFLQYQLAIPKEPGHTSMRAILEAITASGMGSFLAVIKEFGDIDNGGLSFPKPGVTLALDFPNYGEPLLELLEHLDEIVLAAGGRVYLGKDARVSKATFQQMYPEWEAWKAVRDRWDPSGIFRSDLGLRLGLVDSPSREGGAS
ncbi:MAG: decaprenylphospho-beta-D-ribofuranose 2-oxidase [Myxococcota bacterium]|jgi:decaprenylphospho-beta-D-ribofuranose 2-oxidase